MNFFLTFCKTRKKFDKYVKVNRIRNKVIVDIKSILDDEKIDINCEDSMYYFKVLIYKRIQNSIEKNKDIYYIPNFASSDISLDPLFKLREIITHTDNFNLLIFHNEFNDSNPELIEGLLENMELFDTSQIIKDY
jgi:hypothetical protein